MIRKTQFDWKDVSIFFGQSKDQDSFNAFMKSRLIFLHKCTDKSKETVESVIIYKIKMLGMSSR